MSFGQSRQSSLILATLAGCALVLQAQTASAICTTPTRTIQANATFHGATCSASGSQSWCSCSVTMCVLGSPPHATVSYINPNCPPLAEQLTVNAASNQTGYDFYYNGSFFKSGTRPHAYLSGGFRTVPLDLGAVTVQSNGSFKGYRLLTCQAGSPVPQYMTLQVDQASTPVSFSCAFK